MPDNQQREDGDRAENCFTSAVAAAKSSKIEGLKTKDEGVFGLLDQNTIEEL